MWRNGEISINNNIFWRNKMICPQLVPRDLLIEGLWCYPDFACCRSSRKRNTASIRVQGPDPPPWISVHVCAFLWYKPWVCFWLRSQDHSVFWFTSSSCYKDMNWVSVKAEVVVQEHTQSLQVADGQWKHWIRQQRVWNKFSWYTCCMGIESSSAAVLCSRFTPTGLHYTQIQPSHVSIETKPSSEHDSCQKHWWSLQEDPKSLSPWPFDK